MPCSDLDRIRSGSSPTGVSPAARRPLADREPHGHSVPSSENATHRFRHWAHPTDTMTVATSEPTRAPRETDRNYRLGVANGVLFQGGEGFIDANTVIPVFLSRITSSNALIGLATGLPDLGWLLPQVLVAPAVAHERRQMWLYHRAAMVRVVGLAGLAAAVLTLGPEHSGWLLAAFLVGYGLYCLGAGVGAVPFMEVVAKTIPPAKLGTFWSQRLLWGGTAVFAVGFLVREVLAWPEDGLKFGVLFGISSVTAGVAYWLFGVMREPEGDTDRTLSSPGRLLAEGARLLRGDATFRRLLVARSMLNVWYAASPFVVLFAVRDLAAGAHAAGTFLLARMVGFVLSNLLWQRLSSTRGNRTVMVWGVALASGAALAAAAIAVASPWKLGWIGAGAAVIALEAVTAVGGAAQAGISVAYGSLVIQLAPGGRRQAFVTLANTFVAPSMLLPAVGGALLDRTSAPVVFALAGLGALWGTRSATRLPETHHRVEDASGGCADCPGTGGGGA